MNRLETLLSILVEPFQAVENAFIQLSTLLDINLQSGVNLDAIGKIIGQARGGVDDATYQAYLRARIFANRSTGRHEDLLKIASLVLNDPTIPIVLVREGTATARMTIVGQITDAIANVLIALVIPAAALGVRFLIEWSTVPPAATFTFDVGPGFDVGVLATSADNT